MFKRKIHIAAFLVLLTSLMLPTGNANASNASSPSTAQSTNSGSSAPAPAEVSGTDPQPASPDIIELILTILNLN